MKTETETPKSRMPVPASFKMVRDDEIQAKGDLGTCIAEIEGCLLIMGRVFKRTSDYIDGQIFYRLSKLPVRIMWIRDVEGYRFVTRITRPSRSHYDDLGRQRALLRFSEFVCHGDDSAPQDNFAFCAVLTIGGITFVLFVFWILMTFTNLYRF